MPLSETVHGSSKPVAGCEGTPREVRFLCSTEGRADPKGSQKFSEGPEASQQTPNESPNEPAGEAAEDARSYSPQGARKTRPALQRFLEKTALQPNGCRLWTGALQTNGYGSFGIRRGKSVLAHRWIYEQTIGPIPAELQLDHLCRNRRCVEPTHLEAVTAAENNRRGESPSAENIRKTHCKQGHVLAGDNLRIRADGRRCCVTCQREFQRKAWRKTHPEVQANRKPAPLPTAVAEVQP